MLGEGLTDERRRRPPRNRSFPRLPPSRSVSLPRASAEPSPPTPFAAPSRLFHPSLHLGLKDRPRVDPFSAQRREETPPFEASWTRFDLIECLSLSPLSTQIHHTPTLSLPLLQLTHPPLDSTTHTHGAVPDRGEGRSRGEHRPQGHRDGIERRRRTRGRR